MVGKRYSVKDLMSVTLVIALALGLLVPMVRTTLDPAPLVNALEHQVQGWLMVFCTFGMIGFPVLIGTAAIVILRKIKSPFMILYVLISIAFAIASIPFAYRVAQFCAMAVVAV